MMRFRAVAWCMGVSAAACTLYLISGQVAAERGRLEATETQIALVHAETQRLNTELGTRSSQRQLERWNGETLALSTPTARQFLQGGLQLASLDGTVLDRVAGPAQLIAVNATVQKPAAAVAPPVVAAPNPARPIQNLAPDLHYATYNPEAAQSAARPPAQTIRKVAFTTSAAAATAKPFATPAAAKIEPKPRPLSVTPAPEADKFVRSGSKSALDAARPSLVKKPVLKSGTLASLAKTARDESGR